MDIRSPDGAQRGRPDAFRSAEIRVPATGAAWSADVDALNDGVMELRVRPALEGALPCWPEGAGVDCTVDTRRHTYYTAATVVRQAGQQVWLRVPGEWTQATRRATPRATGGFAVRCSVKQECRPATCVDISRGGMCLEVDETVRPDEVVDLVFTLPGDRFRTWARGTVVWARSEGRRRCVRLGVSFTLVSPANRERIADYCRRAVGA